MAAAKPSTKVEKSETQIALENWQRYQYVKERGHDTYVQDARKCEDYYLGGGLQWDADDRAYLENLGRPAIEVNVIFPAVNTAIGMQLHSRVDISVKPRKGDDMGQDMSEVLGKVLMNVCDQIKFSWMETNVFADGMIQQRGYFDFRVDFMENMQGEIVGEVLDPLDVMPDPDATSYDPATWGDVIVARWMTIDEIEQVYGPDKAVEVQTLSANNSGTYGDDDLQYRNRFGDTNINTAFNYAGGAYTDRGTVRMRVIDRQHRVYVMSKVYVYPNGEVFPIPEGSTPEAIAEQTARGAMLSKRMVRRVRWTVSTMGVVLHDDWSPYRTFTVVPFFPYFRRGKTRGMVDNALSPQELLNKATSQFLHIINTSANSGWSVEENSLVNMSPEDLEDQGANAGLVVVHHKGSAAPEKIKPNEIPQGHDRIAEKAEIAIKVITGISDAMQGLNGNEVSGIAIQSKQYQGQAQLGGPLDNLSRTRHMVGYKLLELVQDFYTEERVLMITDDSDPSAVKHEPLAINRQDPITGEVLNDLTVGLYDIVISDVPTQATFQDNQFLQAIEMRDKGIAIPDKFIIAQSNLAKKQEIIDAIEASASQSDPLTDAKAALMAAQTEKTKTETVTKAVEAQYSAMQAANVIASTPMTAPVADQLLLSAGFEDKDAPPIVAAPQNAIAAGTLPPAADGQGTAQVPPPPGAVPVSTNPMTPANPLGPAVGMERGIETQRNDGAMAP